MAAQWRQQAERQANFPGGTKPSMDASFGPDMCLNTTVAATLQSINAYAYTLASHAISNVSHPRAALVECQETRQMMRYRCGGPNSKDGPALAT